MIRRAEPSTTAPVELDWQAGAGQDDRRDDMAMWQSRFRHGGTGSEATAPIAGLGA
jgi:hypothetical protein